MHEGSPPAFVGCRYRVDAALVSFPFPGLGRLHALVASNAGLHGCIQTWGASIRTCRSEMSSELHATCYETSEL
jgi:hypothetical protein